MESSFLEMDTLGLPNLTADINGAQGEAVFVAVVHVEGAGVIFVRSPAWVWVNLWCSA